ncbi:MAG: hypothetical protein ABI724_09025 [Betaproteobacteria bacterium]
MRTRLLLALALVVAGPVHADATRDALAEMARCAEIADSAERLKCYDAAAPRAKSALAAPQPPPADPGTTVESFGLRVPKPVTKAEDFGKPAAPPQPKEITEISGTVVEFARTPRGRSIFFLDNGQVWRQLDGDSTVVRDPDPGKPMKVTVEVGALASYNLTIEGRNGLIKVIRLK